MRFRPHPISFLALAALTAALLPAACQAPESPTGPLTAVPAPSYDKGGVQDHFNEKFEFTDVMFSDGTTRTIRAGSKKTNKDELTTCSYFTQDDDFLGQFQSSDFSSNDADEVLGFCLDHYRDRTTG